MSEKRRVVITGMGVISPIGQNISDFAQSLWEGKCGLSPLELPESPDNRGIIVRVAGQIKDWNAAKHGLSIAEIRRSDRFSQFAVAAAAEAIEKSQLVSGTNISPDRLGVYIGSGIGGLDTFVKSAKLMCAEGVKMISPLFIPMLIPNIAAANVANRWNAQGVSLCPASACATGTNAVGEAFLAIQRGDADAIIAGGSEAAINAIGVAGFQNARALSTVENPLEACLPFDKRRSGFVMSEGAGILILEEYEHAKSRGAHIFAEVCGYGNTNDAYHLTAPAPSGEPAARAMKQALTQAGWQADEALYINAHGTGTRLNDPCETKAIKLALGEAAARKAIISSTKSMTGHMIGAAGAVEAIACALALENSIIPPTIGLDQIDEECDLDYTPLHARKANIDIALSNSLGFGGHNASVVLRKVNE